jgi:hypothetical protein
VILLAIGLVATGCQGGAPSVAPQSSRPTASPTAELSVDETAPQVFYAVVSGNEARFFRSRLDGTMKTQVAPNLRFPNSDSARFARFGASPDGKFVAYRDFTRLYIAQVGDRIDFRELAHPVSPQDRIYDSVWSSDGSMLAYVAGRPSEDPENFDAQESYLYVVRPTGAGRRLVRRFHKPDAIGLVEFSSTRRKIFWSEPVDGGESRGLTLLSLEDGSVRNLGASLPEFHDDMTMSPDLKTAYYVDDAARRLVQFSLTRAQSRTLYQVDTPPKEGARDVGAPILSRDGTRLAFWARVKGDERGTFIVALPDGPPHRLETGNYTPKNLSPDGRFLWLVGGLNAALVMDTQTGATRAFLEQTGPDERVVLLEWLLA